MKRIYSISTALTFVCATSALAVDKAAVLDTYANIAAAKYQDSLVTALRTVPRGTSRTV